MSDIVDEAMSVMEKYTGVVPGYRRAHPRGIGLRGTFTATPEAAALTTAEHMQGEPVDVVVRLSNAMGSPYAPDRRSARHGAVLGLAVRFELPAGGYSTWGAPNITAFPAQKPDQFVAITKGQKNPLRLIPFALLHPRSVPALIGLVMVPATASFATTRFDGLHTYYLIDAEGERRPFRYRWIPDAGIQGPAGDPPPQYLTSEIEERVARGPVSWSLVFQMAEDGDPLDDVRRRWPEGRRQVPAGRLVLDRVHEDQDLVEGYVFSPAHVPAGIELSGDPILRFRPDVYAESHRRRTAETKPPVRAE
jgi:catalase